MVRTLGYKYLKLVHGFLCSKLPTESVETRCSYVNIYVYRLYSGGLETEIFPTSWIQMTLYRQCILAANRGCMHFLYNW